MRVLHLANGNMFGGIETFLVTLARLQQRELNSEPLQRSKQHKTENSLASLFGATPFSFGKFLIRR